MHVGGERETMHTRPVTAIHQCKEYTHITYTGTGSDSLRWYWLSILGGSASGHIGIRIIGNNIVCKANGFIYLNAMHIWITHNFFSVFVGHVDGIGFLANVSEARARVWGNDVRTLQWASFRITRATSASSNRKQKKLKMKIILWSVVAHRLGSAYGTLMAKIPVAR